MCKQKLNIRVSDQPHAAGYSGAALAWDSWVLPEMLKGHSPNSPGGQRGEPPLD